MELNIPTSLLYYGHTFFQFITHQKLSIASASDQINIKRYNQIKNE